MYPNDLDQEMEGYTWGERITPNYTPWYGGWGGYGGYGYRDYMNKQATLAPPYDPEGHFESPYYDYGKTTTNMAHANK
jgi:hypothetical protein